MFRFVLGHLLAIGIGLSLGLIGGGGSILAVPILKYVIGLDTKAAIVTSLVVVGAVSAIGAIPHGLNGNVNLRVAAIFVPPAMLGAFFGAKLASLPIVAQYQLLLFAVVMVIASVLTIRKGRRSGKMPPPDSAFAAPPVLPSARSSRPAIALVALQGLGVGVLTGLVGVGGGFLIIPALVLLGGLPMKEAVGTSLVIITLNSIGGVLGYWGQVSFDVPLVVTFTLAASGGTIAGAQLSKIIDAKSLQTGFGYFVLVVAGFVLFQS